MNNDKIIFTYNQVDFIIKAQRFGIYFSYSDGKGLSFIREYILRLLKLTYCQRKQISDYFQLSKKETEIILDDLLIKKWIINAENDCIKLSPEGLSLFENNNELPSLFTLHDCYATFAMELIDENFIEDQNTSNDKSNAIHLDPQHEALANSINIASRNFQNYFIELKDDAILNLDNASAELYKINDLNTLYSKYFRFTQYFSLDSNGNPLDRSNIEGVKNTENLEQSVTTTLGQYKTSDNLRELLQSMTKIGDSKTLEIIISGKFDRKQFNLANSELENKHGYYFLGQTYHQEALQNTLLNVFQKLKNNTKQPSKKLLWCAPNDIYWGAQDKIKNLLMLFRDNERITKNKQTHKLYDFRLYLPLNHANDTKEKRNWLNNFPDQNMKKNLYGFKDGFLHGNTEIIILEDYFAAICYHVKLPSYDVTIPIGFVTKKKEEIEHILKTFEAYLHAPHDEDSYDFGRIIQ